MTMAVPVPLVVVASCLHCAADSLLNVPGLVLLRRLRWLVILCNLIQLVLQHDITSRQSSAKTRAMRPSDAYAPGVLGMVLLFEQSPLIKYRCGSNWIMY